MEIINRYNEALRLTQYQIRSVYGYYIKDQKPIGNGKYFEKVYGPYGNELIADSICTELGNEIETDIKLSGGKVVCKWTGKHTGKRITINGRILEII